MTSNKPYNRSERVEKQILEIISSIALKNIDLSYLGFITFTSVDISPDLKNAKIYYSVINQNFSDSELEIALNKKQRAFKKFLSPQLHLRSTPKIQFFNDKKFSYQEKIKRLINELPELKSENDFKP
ncbi:MAG: ribosome-binding factor A [Candidatus Marinimicrobia bacterium]|nr:ribosome-binding factor A [Candidatus Neomarinimicrobiota bacterium]